MSARKLLNTEILTRPPRCALFFDKTAAASLFEGDALSIYRTLVRASHSVWGGIGWIVVPFDGHSVSAKQLEILAYYDPDYLPTYRFCLKDAVDLGKRKAIGDTRRPMRITWAPDDKPGLFFLTPFTEEVLRSASPFHSIRGAEPILEQPWLSNGAQIRTPFVSAFTLFEYMHVDSPIVRPRIDTTDPCVEFAVELYVGCDVSPILDSHHPQLSVVDKVFAHASIADMMSSLDINMVGHDGDLASGRVSALGLGQYAWIRRDRKSLDEDLRDHAVVVVGSSVDDLALYWNLTRLKPGVVWLPEAPSKDYVRFLRGLHSKRMHESPPTRVYVVSESLSIEEAVATWRRVRDDATKEFGQWLFQSVDAEHVPDQPLEVLRSVLTWRRRLGTTDVSTRTIVAFENNVAMQGLRSGVPEIFLKLPNTACAWITEYDHVDYLPPPRAALSSLIVDGQKQIGALLSLRDTRWGFDGECRSEPVGVIRWSGSLPGETAPTLLVRPGDTELFERLLASSGFRVSVSDKGRYFLESERLFGGLDHCARWLRDEGYRAMWRMINAPSGERLKGTYFVQKDGRCALLARHLKAAFKDSAKAALTELVKLGVLEPGFVLRCDRCQKKAWYGLDVVNLRFRCDHCRNEQLVLPTNAIGINDPMEPMWYYRLSEMATQLSRHHGDCTVLALSAIKLGAKGRFAFHYAPELALVNADGQASELDILCSLAGNIIVGECKTARANGRPVSISGVEIEKYKTLRKLLSPRHVVFATDADTWSDKTQRRILSEIPSSVFWTRRQLLQSENVELE